MGPASLPIQLGDVATWVGGIATAVALLLTWRLLRITRQEQSAAREEERQAQARLVSAWSDNVGPVSNAGFHTVTVKLRNSSDESIYGVRIAIGQSWFDDNPTPAELGILHIVPPRSTQKLEVKLSLDLAPDGSYEASPPVEIIFYDASHGQLWIRNRFGVLAQIESNESHSPAEHFFKKDNRLS